MTARESLALLTFFISFLSIGFYFSMILVKRRYFPSFKNATFSQNYIFVRKPGYLQVYNYCTSILLYCTSLAFRAISRAYLTL